MNRPTLNWLVDLLAFAAFVLLTATGVLARYVLPPGSGRFATLWGLDRHGWGDIHYWVAIALLAVLALHLALHWRWILCMLRGQRSQASGMRLGLGLVGLIGLLGVAVAPFFAQIERRAEPPQRARFAPAARQPAPPGLPASPGAPVSPVPTVAPTPPGAADAGEESGIQSIRGSMSLQEVTEVTGVPFDALIRALGLPPGIDPEERIGRLRRQYAVGPDEVRRAVKGYRAAH